MKKIHSAFAAIAVSFLLSFTAQAVADDAAVSSVSSTIKTSTQGLVISTPGMSAVNVAYPIIAGEKIVSAQPDGMKADVSYDGGTKLTVEIKDDGTVNLHFDALPSGVKRVEIPVSLNPDLGHGGAYRVCDGNAFSFPAKTPHNIILYADNQSFRLAVHDATGRNFVIHPPEHAFLQLEDRRQGVSGIFLARFFVPLVPDMTLRVGDAPPAYAPANLAPISIPRAAKPIVIDGKTDEWSDIPAQQIPSSRLVDGAFKSVKPEDPSDPLSAAFQACWDDKNLYLLVTVTDPAPLHNINPANKLWTGDAVELYLGSQALDMTGDLLPSDRQFIMGADEIAGSLVYVRGPADQPYIDSVAVPSAGGWTLEAAIPFQVLGFTPKVGRQLRFDLGIDDSVKGKDRRCQLMWNGTSQNSSDRTNWGRAVLVK